MEGDNLDHVYVNRMARHRGEARCRRLGLRDEVCCHGQRPLMVVEHFQPPPFIAPVGKLARSQAAHGHPRLATAAGNGQVSVGVHLPEDPGLLLPKLVPPPHSHPSFTLHL